MEMCRCGSVEIWMCRCADVVMCRCGDVEIWSYRRCKVMSLVS